MAITKILALVGLVIFLQTVPIIECKTEWYMMLNGQIRLVGLFDVHMEGYDLQQKWVKCGPIDAQNGLMQVEAMLFAIDQINKNSSFLYGLTLAARIHDTCGDAEHRRSSIAHAVNYYPQGVIGPAGSDAAKTVTSLFSLYRRTVISYSASSPVLEDRTAYPFFYRTVPSDRELAKLLVNVATRFDWTYVAVVSSTGNSGVAIFRHLANSHGICTPIDTQVAENVKPEELSSIFDRIVDRKAIRVVYLFLKKSVLLKLFKWADNATRKYDHLNFVFGERMGTSVYVRRGKSITNGSLMVQIRNEEVPEFREYFLNLKPEKNQRNVWFEEFWERIFNCSVKGNSMSLKNCTGKEKLKEGRGYVKDTPVLPVINAVFAYAHAFRKIIEQECLTRNKSAQHCYSKEKLLYKYTGYHHVISQVDKVCFQEPYRDRVFRFNSKHGYAEDYAIYNYFADGKTNERNYAQIGKWNTSKSWRKIATVTHYGHKASPLEKCRLDLKTGEIKWRDGNTPISVCSQPCAVGQIMKYGTTGRKCCWLCVSCSDNDIVRNNKCLPCKMNDVPDAARRTCKTLPVKYPGLKTPVVAAVSCSSSIGVFCTTFVIGLFLKNSNTRVVRESGRELCLNMLIGIAGTYIVPVVYIIRPSKAVCSLQRLALSFSLTMSYAPLLLKINRIYRIFQSAKTSVQRPAMVRPKSQIFLSLALTAVSLLIGLVSITGSNTKIKAAYPKHREYTLRFCELSSQTVFMNLSYSTALMVATTWFAFKTRHFPRNYNEAKYIGFTMYATCLVLAVFLPVFYVIGDGNGMPRVIIICCICELIATVNLFGLFGRKVLLILRSHADAADSRMPSNSSSLPKTQMQAQVAPVTSEGSSTASAGIKPCKK